MFKIEADGTPTLEIKIRQPPTGVCGACLGTGVVIPSDGETRNEVGNFCSECDEGKRRWREVVNAVSETETALSYAGLGTAERE